MGILLNGNEIWDIWLKELMDYINEHKQRSSQSDKDINIKKL